MGREEVNGLTGHKERSNSKTAAKQNEAFEENLKGVEGSSNFECSV